MSHVVGVADLKVARGIDEDFLVTHALGSCLGLTIYDPKCQVGGMLHAMLPMSKINPEKAARNPFLFVDTGVPELFAAFYAAGGDKSRVVVKAAGCGEPLQAFGRQRIAKEAGHLLGRRRGHLQCDHRTVQPHAGRLAGANE